MKIDISNMDYWFWRIEKLGIPIPKTRKVRIFKEDFDLYIQESVRDVFVKKVQRKIDKYFSLPVFLRTSNFSHKHGWKKSCYFDGTNDLSSQILDILSMSLVHDLPYHSFWIREYIPMITVFEAFYGNMPINREYRVFVRNGKITCFHPYWFKEAIRPNHNNPLPKDWEKLIDWLFQIRTEDYQTIMDYSQKVATEFNKMEFDKEGFSVDFSQGENGKWYLLDMGEYNRSYHFKDCKFKPEETFV